MPIPSSHPSQTTFRESNTEHSMTLFVLVILNVILNLLYYMKKGNKQIMMDNEYKQV
uniref:Uncharacterized protein n=1 Tax=Arion vulgaris TaxID=1028688 RepID=A0A0B7AS64_9EUPU